MFNKINKLLRYSVKKNSLGTPPSLIFFITSRCNAQCSHCFNWKNLNQKNDMTLEDIGTLSAQLGQMDSLLLSGGEPFLRKDMVEICCLFFENNKINTLSIPTNGLLPTLIAEKTEKILQAAYGKKVFVNISLDGTRQTHDNIRCVPGAFKKAIESYQCLTKLKKNHSNLNIGINTTVSNENYENLVELVDELKAITPDLENLNLSFLRGLPKNPTYKLPTNEKLTKIYRHVTNTFGAHRPIISKTIDDEIFRLKMKTLRKKTQVLTCQAGRLLGVVDANGDVRLCELLEPIGNLREASFKEIWQSREAEQIRNKIANHQCWCTHECFLLPTMLAHPTYYPFLFLRLIRNLL